MIDLHSHLLPGIDDGASDMDVSIAMARAAVADGTTIMACTSHITPSVYENNSEIIGDGVRQLQQKLHEAEIPLTLVVGADVHIAPGILAGLQDGSIPCLGKSKYFLFEPSHHVLPPNIDRFAEKILSAGFTPILTHPERLSWIENHYGMIERLDDMGLAIQLTAASITGRFGKGPQYWSHRMLEEGRVDIIASDAHDIESRPPGLSSARDAVTSLLSEAAADNMVRQNPARVLKGEPLLPKNRQGSDNPVKYRTNRKPGFLKRLFDRS